MIEWFWAFIEAFRYYPTIVQRGWWKQWPFLPLVPERFIKFRLDTNYGMVEHGWKRPPWWKIVLDTKTFLTWRRKYRISGKLHRSSG